MNEVLYGHYMLIDIIVHDALVICMSGVVHISFIIYVTWYRHAMVHHIAYAWETSHFMGASAWLVNRHCVRCLIRWAR